MNDLVINIRFNKFGRKWEPFVFPSGLHVIHGESGVGKSRLLDAIQDKPTAKGTNFEIDVNPHEHDVYRIYQNPDHQIIASTVSNEITFAGECKQFDPNELKEILDHNLKFLPDHIDPMMNPGYLSGGEKELLNLITALDFDSPVLLIDDGLSFLSKENKLHCMEMMHAWLKRSKGVIIWITSDHEDLSHGDSSLVLSLDSLSEYRPSNKTMYDDTHIPKGEMNVDIKGLTFGYEGHRKIYSDLSMKIENIRSLGLLGDNGSGKTTFAGLCFGDLSPNKGEVEVSIVGSNECRIGYLDQFPEHLILLKTVEELFMELKENQVFDVSMDNTFKKRLNRFGIQWDHVAHVRGIDLPWAVLRILLVIMLCHCHFNVLILDEPTFGLGWDQRVKLRSFIRECMSNMHFMIISHDRKFIRSICDNVIDVDKLDKIHVKHGKTEKTKS